MNTVYVVYKVGNKIYEKVIKGITKEIEEKFCKDNKIEILEIFEQEEIDLENNIIEGVY